jgi:hypothetical protein
MLISPKPSTWANGAQTANSAHPSPLNSPKQVPYEIAKVVVRARHAWDAGGEVLVIMGRTYGLGDYAGPVTVEEMNRSGFGVVGRLADGNFG